MKRILSTLLATITLALSAHAIPLRALIDQEMSKEQPGVLTAQEIKDARTIGASFFKQHAEGDDVDRLDQSSAKAQFAGNTRKQREWILELRIGYMMAAEASLWDPSQN
jgi:hypothetical protein